MMLSWAQLNLNLKCQQLTLIKKKKWNINPWVHIARHELITDFWQGGVVELHFSWVLLRAPKKLSETQEFWWKLFIFECLYTLVVPLKYLVWITLITIAMWELFWVPVGQFFCPHSSGFTLITSVVKPPNGRRETLQLMSVGFKSVNSLLRQLK